MKDIENKLKKDKENLEKFIKEWEIKGKSKLTIVNISCGVCNNNCENCCSNATQ